MYRYGSAWCFDWNTYDSCTWWRYSPLWLVSVGTFWFGIKPIHGTVCRTDSNHTTSQISHIPLTWLYLCPIGCKVSFVYVCWYRPLKWNAELVRSQTNQWWWYVELLNINCISLLGLTLALTVFLFVLVCYCLLLLLLLLLYCCTWRSKPGAGNCFAFS